jgi:hypothetical protein
VHRPRFAPSLILELPYLKKQVLQETNDTASAKAKAISKMNFMMKKAAQMQMSMLISNDNFPTQNDIDEIDNYIFEHIGLRQEEISAIKEYIKLILPATQPNKGSRTPELWQPSTKEQWKTYCSWLSRALTEAMQENGTRALAGICAYSQDIVVVQIEHQQRINDDFPSASLSCPRHLQELSRESLAPFQRKLDGNIYLQRCVLVFEDHKIYIIKPRTRRFWLTGMAYADANRVIEHLLQAAYGSGGEK